MQEINIVQGEPSGKEASIFPRDLIILKTISRANITPEYVNEHVQLPKTNSAKLTIESVLPRIQIYTSLSETHTNTERSMNSVIINLGLIAHYAKENPKDKPPFTSKNDNTDWDLTPLQKTFILKSLEPNVIEIAQNFINNPGEIKDYPKDIPIEEMVTAVAYLKVKEIMEPKNKENEWPQIITTEEANYE